MRMSVLGQLGLFWALFQPLATWFFSFCFVSFQKIEIKWKIPEAFCVTPPRGKKKKKKKKKNLKKKTQKAAQIVQIKR